MNPYLLGLLNVGSILVALGATVATVAAGVSRKRLPPGPALLAIAMWAAFAWTEARQEPTYDAGEIAAVARAHDAFRPRLEQYRAEHGEYPASLGLVGVQPPVTAYGPVRYEAAKVDGRPVYRLVVGDYVRNGFVSTWRSERGEWGLRRDD